MAVDRSGISHGWRLLGAILLAVSLVGAAIFFDEQREFEAALLALQDEQVALATAMAADLEGRINRADENKLQGSADALARAVPQLLGGAIELQQKRSRVILVSPPSFLRFFNAEGQTLYSPVLRSLLFKGQERAMLGRQHARVFDLPERIVVLGMRRVKTASGQSWGIVVAASAERLRERERHAQLRFLLGLGFVALVIGGFGGLALRDQRRKLAIARELEVAALQRERENLLARADKMATMAALSSGVAHQIATPLGTITARVEQVMFVVQSNAKATAALNVVLEQVQRIQHTIRGLLDLARGNQPTLQATRPESVVRAAAAAVSHRFHSSGVQLEVSIAEQLPLVSCDPPILEQAVVNLLLNALEASETRAPVRVRVQAVEARVLISVDDQGHGISDETIARAGEPFYTHGKQRGTGLGLSIAQEIVQNLGGKLVLERRLDVSGTRAVIELPRT